MKKWTQPLNNWAWGYNNKGQLGDNTYEKRFSPVQIGHGKKWESVK
jgi:alpha-tubulin suppressor-like RCC1 family protein